MKRETRRLQRTLLLHFLLYLVLGVVALMGFQILILDGMANDAFADWFVSWVQRTYAMSESAALYVYQRWFVSPKNLYMMIAFAVVGFTAFWLVTRRVTQYLRAIAGEMDKLLKGRTLDIQLPGEVAFMGARLHHINLALLEKEHAAKEAEQRKNDLVVYLAHDLKTPLTSITGYLSLLSEAPDMPLAQRAQYTGIALEKAYRLQALIDEFFDITRFALQSTLLQKERLDLRRMLEQMADEFYPALVAQGKWTDIEMEEDVHVLADPDKLARIIDNLIKNAIAYSDKDTAIAIKAMQAEDAVIVTVTNQGITIPPERIEMIFDRFFRLDAARQSGSGGAGLGLAIARELARAHDGTLTAQSMDGVTTFTLRLPA